MNNFQQFLMKNKPGFLLGSGIGLLLSAIASAYVLGPLAKEAVEKEKERQGVDELSAKDLIRTTGPYILPTAALAVSGTICVVKGDKLNIDKGTEAIAAYALLKASDKEYREKTKEMVGEKKEKRIRESIAQDHVDNDPPEAHHIYYTGKGNVICRDAWTGKYFYGDYDKLKRIETNIDRRILDENFVPINEYYLEAGMDEVEAGRLGWRLENGYMQMNIITVMTKDHQPCFEVSFREPDTF